MNTTPPPIVILMADDNEGDRRFVREMLAGSPVGLDIRCVEDGQELMDYLQHRGPYGDERAAPHPGLILLDLYMPRKTGHEALQEIRNDPELCDIPVVVLTASQEQSDFWQCYASGITHLMIKPVNPVAIENLIEASAAYWRRRHRA